MNTVLASLAALAAGAMLWSFAEYLLHRFAMHHLHGRGIMSREHLEHHVTSGWAFDVTHLMSWAGMLTVGAVAWFPLGSVLVDRRTGVLVAVGWALGYFFYEYQHATAHLRAPRGAYGRWLRKHHFHHHFGHPMANHGVTSPIWDKVFGTLDRPARVRVPRRMALPWLVDEHGELHGRFAHDYVLVGSRDGAERLAGIDRARAFASQAPVD